jgi:hypothetical protein
MIAVSVLSARERETRVQLAFSNVGAAKLQYIPWHRWRSL